jgi:hypothetical protein
MLAEELKTVTASERGTSRTDAVREVHPTPIHFEGIDGLRLVGDRYGDPEAPAVVFLHGGGRTRYSWGGPLPRLRRAGGSADAGSARHGESDWHGDGDYRA